MHIATITYTLTYEDKHQHPIALEIEDDMVFVSFEGIGTIEDRLAPGRKGVTVDRTWILVKEGSYRLQAGFFTTDEGVPNDLFIPAVWYRDNTKGSGLFPSIDHSTIWSFLETRMSIPCCLQLSGGKRHFLCATEAAAEERFVASVTNDPHGAIISIPGWEGPYSYQGKKALIDTTSMPRPALMVPSGGLIYRRTFHLATYRGMRGMEAYVAFVASLPKAKPTDLPHPLSWNHWMELKLTRLINLVRRSENNLAYIIMGEGNGEVQDVYEFTGASFLVKSIQGACELARFTEHELTLDCLQAARQSLAKRFSLVDDSRLLATVAKKIGDFFLNSMEEKGFVGLVYYDSGARSFYNTKKPIYTVADLRGMKIRVQESALMMGLVRSLGAVPTPMAYGDVYSALQTGVIDGAENNWPSYDTSSHYEVAKYYSLDEHTRVPEMIVASKITMDKLSKEDQEIIKRAARESQKIQIDSWAEYEKKSEAKVRAAGSQINKIKDQAEFAAAMAPLYQSMLSDAQREWVEKIKAVR